ncbi:MAG: hypothetical protein NTV68_15155, partial [Methanomicrobiales archaeon]|nr:hypothetical protein [Methanomicrobiales archaeon]
KTSSRAKTGHLNSRSDVIGLLLEREDPRPVLLHDDDLPAYFVKRIGPDPFVVYVALNHDPDNPEEYDWSDTVNYPPKIEDGTPCSGKITIRSIKPETLIFPWMNSIVP